MAMVEPPVPLDQEDLDAEIATLETYLKANAGKRDAHVQNVVIDANLPTGSTDLTVPPTPVLNQPDDEVVNDTEKTTSDVQAQ
ncbi:hypothetical protein ACOSP7_022887 [Xanthoceras sorbifolium]